MKLNQELVRRGFRIENGNLVKYTIFGRKRKNWKSNLRGKSQQFIKEECKECGSNENLTIHHRRPLSKNGSVSKENCQTLCRGCHDVIHDMNNGKKKIKKKKSKKKKNERILVLEQDEWGCYRIIN